MGILTNKISKESLKPGDHIYSWRQAYVYAHHGIYCGNNRVIHFTTGDGQELETGTIFDRYIFRPSNKQRQPCIECLNRKNPDGVTESCLECFLAGGDLCLFSYSVSPAFFLATRGGTCTLAKSDPPEAVLHRATFLLKNSGFGAYSLFKNNCEDFAIYCKTGLVVNKDGGSGRSNQISALTAAVSAAVSSPLAYGALGFGGMAAVGCGLYGAKRLACNGGVRRDVVKLPVEEFIVSGSDEDEPEIVIKKKFMT